MEATSYIPHLLAHGCLDRLTKWPFGERVPPDELAKTVLATPDAIVCSDSKLASEQILRGLKARSLATGTAYVIFHGTAVTNVHVPSRSGTTKDRAQGSFQDVAAKLFESETRVDATRFLKSLARAAKPAERVHLIADGEIAWPAAVYVALTNEVQYEGTQTFTFTQITNRLPPVDDSERSVFRSKTPLFQVAPMDTVQIASMAASEAVSLNTEEVVTVQRKTGGHPESAIAFLDALRQGRGGKDRVDDAGAALVWSPPPFVDAAAKVLLDVVRGDRSGRLTNALREYVRGRNRYTHAGNPADRVMSSEAALHLTGWIGLWDMMGGKEQLYGIRSWLHQSWARTVLNELRR